MSAKIFSSVLQEVCWAVAAVGPFWRWARFDKAAAGADIEDYIIEAVKGGKDTWSEVFVIGSQDSDEELGRLRALARTPLS